MGALRDPSSGELSYSGVRRSGIHPMRFSLVPPEDRPIEVETLNGNVALVSRAAIERVGRSMASSRTLRLITTTG